MMTIASQHVHVHSIGGKRQFDRGMYGARAAPRAWSGPVKHERLRDGETTVEFVPTMTKNNDGHIIKTHYDDFIAACTQ